MRGVLKFVVAPVFVALTVFSLVNSCDRTLNSDIAQFVSTTPAEIPPDDNAYFALLGHNSAAGLEAHAEGVAFAGFLDEKFTADRQAFKLLREELSGSPALVVQGGDELLGESCFGNCLELSRARSSEIRALVRDNRELVERYRDLYRYRLFAETTPLAFNAEAISTVRETQKIVILDIALQGLDSGVEAALSALEQDMSFWRVVLGGTRRLGNKMTAVSALRHDIGLLAEIAANFEIDGMQAERIIAAARPLSAEERSLTPAMRAEFGCVIEDLTDPLPGARAKTAKLYQENATKNLAFEHFRREIEIYDQRAPEWLRRYERLRAEKEDRFAFNPLQLFYNFTGKIMLPLAYPDFSLFPVKVHNLDGYLGMLRAQLEMKLLPVAEDGVSKFLEGNCPDNCDPYTLQPFTWNAAERSLSFQDPVFGKPRSLTVRGQTAL